MDDKDLIINNDNNKTVDIEIIYKDIKEKILTARSKMLKHIDTTMIEVYWYVGKITYELSENSTKASYGKKIIDALSAKLTNEFGSGFSPVSIRRMRKFFELYPIWSAVPTELSWSHFQELIRVNRKNDEQKEYYGISKSIKKDILYDFNYVVPELLTDILLFKHFAKSKNKKMSEYDTNYNSVITFYSKVIDALQEILTENQVKRVRKTLAESPISERY